jgi:hypothetical protein
MGLSYTMNEAGFPRWLCDQVVSPDTLKSKALFPDFGASRPSTPGLKTQKEDTR